MRVEKRIVKVDNVPDKYRLIVISDIHAHKTALDKLLHQIKLTDNDYLVILGDFVEKGPSSLEMIYKIRDLKQRPKTYVLMGNCERALVEMLTTDEMAEGVKHYVQTCPWDSLLKSSVEALNINLKTISAADLQLQLRNYLKKEIDILSSLDTAVEFDQFIFVHAGVEYREDWENSDVKTMTELQYFLDQGHCVKDKYFVVGHTPTSNYYDTIINNSMVISHRKKIISIDGGMGVKEIAQLNGLVIDKDDDGYIYLQYHVDEFTKAEVLVQNYPKFASTVKVAWPNTQIEVHQIGTSFSWCKKIATNEFVFIKNEFIYEKDGQYYCKDDYVSSMIEVQPGDIVSLVGTYGKYAYIAKDGIVGWIRLDHLKVLVK